ncbi:MAG: FG-GAP repeat protein [Trueperaceae bacterium]|nr:MAG: FG-GAP repeat protein [Trueperaceae bacterium]
MKQAWSLVLLITFILAACNLSSPGIENDSWKLEGQSIGALPGAAFQPPIGPIAVLTGDFRDDLRLSIEVFTLNEDGTASGVPLGPSFSNEAGTITDANNPFVEEYYSAVWDTGVTGVPDGTRLRVEVRLEHAEADVPVCNPATTDLGKGCLAFFDVELWKNRGQARKAEVHDLAGDIVHLANDDLLQIKLHVRDEAVACFPKQSESQLLPASLKAGARLSRVSIDEDLIIAGAPFYNGVGTAWLFERQANGSWQEVARLTPSGLGSGDEYGNAVAISGNTTVVSAAKHDNPVSDAGVVYVFERQPDNSIIQSKLFASDGAGGDLFGRYTLDIDGDVLVIGAPFDDDQGQDSGSVYVFERQAPGHWTQTQKLTAFDGVPGAVFGSSNGVVGDTIIVSAPRDDDNGVWSGSVYVYEKTVSGWTFVQKVSPDDGAAGDRFGAVSFDGMRFIGGGRFNDDNGDASGSAYIFERIDGSWTQVAKLLPSDGGANDRFGVSVSVDGRCAVVGSLGNAGAGLNTGSIYTFRKQGDNTWQEIAKIKSFNAQAADDFGGDAWLDGRTIAAGARRNDAVAGDSGSVYVYDLY